MSSSIFPQPDLSLFTFIDPLAFLPMKFSLSQIEHVIDAADTSLADRSGKGDSNRLYPKSRRN